MPQLNIFRGERNTFFCYATFRAARCIAESKTDSLLPQFILGYFVFFRGFQYFRQFWIGFDFAKELLTIGHVILLLEGGLSYAFSSLTLSSIFPQRFTFRGIVGTFCSTHKKLPLNLQSKKLSLYINSQSPSPPVSKHNQTTPHAAGHTAPTPRHAPPDSNSP
jgi:hypothetical protein